MPTNNNLHSGPESTPVPDPTAMTTAALQREIASLKELVDTRLNDMDKAQELFDANLNRVPSDVDKQIQHLKAFHGARLDELSASIGLKTDVLVERFRGMDLAVKILEESRDKFTVQVNEKINSLKDVHDEKFLSIGTQFKERDVRTEQSSKDSKVAVDAALQAAKEAVGEQNKSSSSAIAKSEAATAKQIDQIMQLIQTGNKAVDDKIGDIKDRITRLEGLKEGRSTEITDRHATGSYTVMLTAIIISAISLVISAFIALRK